VTVTQSEQRLEPAELWARSGKILAHIAEGAAERESVRELPYDAMRQLAAARLGTWRVPVDAGGPGASIRETIEFVIALAAVDANIAQAIRSHFSFVEHLRVSPSPVERERWFAHVLDGRLFGLASGEIRGAHGDVSARVVRDGDHWRLTGEKYYCTGTLFAEWTVVSALDEDDVRRAIAVPTDRDGVEVVDDWDGIGQRLTASGTTRLVDVKVTEGEFLHRTYGKDDTRPRVSPFLQLFLAAVEVGIGKNAITDAVSYAREKARPIKHSLAATSVEDPYVQHAVGEMSARTYAAEAAVLRAAEAIDRIDAEPLGSPGEQQAVLAASLEVAQAQFIAIESALKTAELLFDVGGARTTQREHNFDRHWRNARTVANHNPRYYKAGVVGAYELTGTEPPANGFF
jgi:alkylation response protein AidB-like acyl-CoA dehydrogenase